MDFRRSRLLDGKNFGKQIVRINWSGTTSSVVVGAGVYLPATFAKPSANFTNSLPFLFGLLSTLWLKTDAGPRNGEDKKW